MRIIHLSTRLLTLELFIMLGERLAEARRRRGLAQVDLAVALGKDRSLVSHVESNRAGLLVDGLVKAARELAVSVDYLLGLTDDPTPSAQLSEQVGIFADVDLGDLPGVRHVEIREIAASAGGGAEVWDETITGYQAFQRMWLDRHSIDPDQCCVISVRGESMEPTLPDGCSILVDRNRGERRDGRIYVMRTEDGLVVKRLGRDQDGNWNILSDNQVWEPVAWSNDVEIIGEVRWAATVF